MTNAKKKDCETCVSRLDSVFCSLEGERVKQLNAAKTTNFYRRGQIMFYEGNRPTGLFCLSSGKVKVFKSGADGNETLLRIAKAGDILGYRSLLTNENFQATAEVLEDTAICFIDRTSIQQLLKDEPKLAFELIHRLGHELGEAETRLNDMFNKTAKQRLCRLLLAMAKIYGIKDAEGMLLDIPLTRAEIGSLVGATPETVIRLLSEFKKEGYIRQREKRIVVSDAAALARESELEI